MPRDVIADADMTEEQLRVDLEESDKNAKPYERQALRLLGQSRALRENRDRCRVRSGKLRELLAKAVAL